MNYRIMLMECINDYNIKVKQREEFQNVISLKETYIQDQYFLVEVYLKESKRALHKVSKGMTNTLSLEQIMESAYKTMLITLFSFGISSSIDFVNQK